MSDGNNNITIGEVTEILNDKMDRDGQNANGADVVIEWQMPNANNNYTWYRKYKSGWVEQGGRATLPSGGNTVQTVSVALSITMANNAYFISPRPFFSQPSAYYGWSVSNITTTGFSFLGYNNVDTYTISWQVSGMAA